MKPSEIKRVLEERGWKLLRSFGQNFLHDAHQLDRIVEAAELEEGDQVLEIGPGLGALTARLLERAGQVWVIEKDRRLAAFLEERFGDRPNFRLTVGDALSLLEETGHDWSAWKMVSNLPYSVASPILVALAQQAQGPQRMVATVQWEVAQRLAATSGGPDFGLLTLLVQLHYTARICFRICATCFYPPPEVESACVLLRRRTALLLEAALEPAFCRLAKQAFSQRRKMMFKVLKANWPEPQLADAFAAVGVSRTSRAERVSLEQFVALTRRLAGAVAGPAK